MGTGGAEAAEILAEVPVVESAVSSQFDLEYRREVFRWAADQVRDSVHESTWLAFQLTHIEGHSVVDAATKLKVNIGTIYVSRSRVMSRLQDLVKEYEVQ